MQFVSVILYLLLPVAFGLADVGSKLRGIGQRIQTEQNAIVGGCRDVLLTAEPQVESANDVTHVSIRAVRSNGSSFSETFDFRERVSMVAEDAAGNFSVLSYVAVYRPGAMVDNFLKYYFAKPWPLMRFELREGKIVNFSTPNASNVCSN